MSNKKMSTRSTPHPISLRMEEELVERLTSIAQPRRLSISYVIREACWEYIELREDEAGR